MEIRVNDSGSELSKLEKYGRSRSAVPILWKDWPKVNEGMELPLS